MIIRRKILIKTLLFLVCFSSLLTHAQEQKFVDSVITPLHKNQLFFEKVHIHTNKTTYFPTDNIWFKAYVGDFDNRPSLKTTRLYVNLLDSKGNAIKHKTVFVYKGTGKGDFQLDDTLEHGKYYIQAYTNYMRNFGDDNYFIQEINILNDSTKKEVVAKNNYDIQLLPEGGYLLGDVENVIGIKSLINGKSYGYSGYIVNGKNKQIVSFKSEHLGMTKCKFYYDSKEKYKAILNINDTVIKIDVPVAKSKGIVINIDNENEAFVDVTLKTNNRTLNKFELNNYNLLLHQNNRIIDFVEISKIDSTSVNLKLEKSFFYRGVNSITLFQNNTPILERKIFIEKPISNLSVTLQKESKKTDSVKYKIGVLKSQANKSVRSNLSVSVLPLNTSSFSEKVNIKSAFLLTPFVKGFIENPAYYFNKNNPNRTKYLDLLLLTQGWIQYTLNEMIEELNPSYKYDFELGFKLNGTVSPVLHNELVLISNNNLLIDKVPLNEKTDFSFSKLLVYKGDTVKVSFFNDLKETVKPRAIYFDSIKTKTSPKFKPYFFGLSNAKETQDDIDNSWKSFYYANATQLEKVTVVGKKRSDRYYQRQKLLDKYKTIVYGIGQYYDLQLPETYKSHNDDLMSYLRFNEGVTLVNWKGVENYLQVNGNNEASLSIDGERITSEELPHVLIDMEDVEAVFVSQTKGFRSYQVFTADNYKKNIKLLYAKHVIEDGFDKAKKYYAPFYDNNTVVSNEWLEIDWKPNLITNATGEVSFSIKENKNLEGLLFSIQGFSEAGDLISEIIKTD